MDELIYNHKKRAIKEEQTHKESYSNRKKEIEKFFEGNKPFSARQKDNTQIKNNKAHFFLIRTKRGMKG